jgi:hypothetical protein
MKKRGEAERGAATVEQAALAALIALLVIAAVSAVAAGGKVDAGRSLAGALARRLTCAPRLPGACRHHPLVPAYGWPVARLVRALAPRPEALRGPSGLPLAPVDFRRCRSEGCAVAAGPHLTATGRRTTAFTEVMRGPGDRIEIVYWLYRPSLGWESVRRSAARPDVEAAAAVEVLLQDDPALVPLETLPGRNHYPFRPDEEPPWRWRIEGRYPGWSS